MTLRLIGTCKGAACEPPDYSYYNVPPQEKAAVSVAGLGVCRPRLILRLIARAAHPLARVSKLGYGCWRQRRSGWRAARVSSTRPTTVLTGASKSACGSLL